jgi:hypothetical protein
VNVRYLPEALAEYEAAAAWYDDRSPGAGDDFADAIERAELLIAESSAPFFAGGGFGGPLRDHGPHDVDGLADAEQRQLGDPPGAHLGRHARDDRVDDSCLLG